MTHQRKKIHQSTQLTSARSQKRDRIALPLGATLTALLLSTEALLPLASFSHPQPAGNQQLSSQLIAQTPTTARVLYVNPSRGSDSASAGSTEASAYRTITYALQQAQAGTVVQLAPGSYTTQSGEVFPISIPQGVILRGDESTKGQNVTIIGGNSYVSRTFAQQNVTVVAGRDSEVRGVSITNPNGRGTGLWIESTNPVVRNNTFKDSLRDGVFVSGSGNPKIEDNIFINNQGNGISIDFTARGEIRRNVFQDTGFGLAIGGDATPLIAENRILQNTDGMLINRRARPILRNNVIENNDRDGIVVIASAQPNLGTGDDPGNNIIRNNGRYEIYNATTNTIVAVGNDIDRSGISGPVDFVAATVTPPGGGAFPDIAGHWAQAYIQALASRGVISGFPDGTFKPNDPVTRAQFAAIINKAFAPPARESCGSFGDVSSSFWGFEAIRTACRGGFLAGYPGNVFRPDQRIPRVQALVALVSGLNLRSENTSVLSVYTDQGQIPSWATTAIAGATQNGLVVNYPNTNRLNPSQEASRAEVAAFVYQALVNAGKVEAISSPYVVRTP